jgi:hypothetical protein
MLRAFVDGVRLAFDTHQGILLWTWDGKLTHVDPTPHIPKTIRQRYPRLGVIFHPTEDNVFFILTSVALEGE